MRTPIAVVAVSALVATGSSALAADVVGATEVAAALRRGAIAWDVRGADEYAKGHIPGAVSIGNAGSVLRNPNTEDFIPAAQVENLLNAAGIDLSKEIIAYGRMGDPVAHWVLIAVRQFGGRSGKVFYGGLDEWQAAGEPVSTEAARLAPVEQRLTPDPSVQVGLAEVRSKVGNPGVQFVDTRSPAEFVGDDIRALRGGHIPGARNVPYEQNWLDPGSAAKLSKGEVKTRDGMALKPPRQIEALYAALDPGKETIVYCQSGMRAALTATVLRDLGFGNVRVFEDSWLGYGNDLSARAEDVQFVNIGELKTRIKSLEGAVEELAAEIRTLKASKP